jgi:hypothetical protein
VDFWCHIFGFELLSVEVDSEAHLNEDCVYGFVKITRMKTALNVNKSLKFPKNFSPKSPGNRNSSICLKIHGSYGRGTDDRSQESIESVKCRTNDFDKADEKASFSIEKKIFYFFLTKILQNRMKS